MAVYEPHEVLHRCADGSWKACAHERRLVFLNSSSVAEVPVGGPLRWCLDGTDMSFERALETLPEELHGWMALAAIIALRHCVDGIATGVALPAGYHEWGRLAARAEPVCAWMHVLARLDGIEMPPLPGSVDDGVSQTDAAEAA